MNECLITVVSLCLPRAKGRRDGISSSSENPRPGPHTLVLHKNSQGFGFTLRHFIVYPPESALHTSLKDEENGNGKGLHRSCLEPMDTIFVKNVREKGPAHQAGLCTGDRLVKVNGESVLGKTYSQVIAYSHDAYLRGNNPYTGKAQNLPPPPPVLYPPHTNSQPPALAGPAPASSHMGQNQLDNWSRWPGSSSGPSPPLHHAHLANHNMGTAVGHIGGRKESPPWSSPSQSISTPPSSRSDCTQQALSNWYYSQVPGRERERERERERSVSRSMHPRQRSFSQDRLGDIGRATRSQQAGFPHSASQDTLLLLQQSSAARYGHSARSLETLDRAVGILSPRLERSTWVHQPPKRTESYLRHTPQPQQADPQARRLPSCQSLDEEQVGYRSYSPSFNRKTGRILQQAQSFRDPSYTGPHLWTPTPKTSSPEGLPHSATPSPAPPTTSSTTAIPTPPEGQDRTYRPTNHDRGAGEATGEAQTQEVVLRQKPPTGRRGANALRHPHYGIPPTKAESAISHRRTNGNLPPLSIEDDSLASIPFIDEPTSPSADLRACHVPASSVVSSGSINSAPPVATSPTSPTFTFPLNRLFSHDCSDPKSNRRSSYLLAITTERSKSCDEGLNVYREEGRVFSRIPKRVKSFFTEGSLDSLAAAEEARSKRHSTSELGNISYSDVKREGWLHFKQIHTEKGKKEGSAICPWRRVFSVLRSHSLFLYKDKREAVLKGAALGGGAEEEQPISIRGCLVDIAYSETKRKHALRLTTQDFCEYLLQAEDREDMLEWIRVIRENSKTDNEELGFSRQALINKKLNDYRKQSPTGNKPESSPRVSRMTFLLSKQDNSAPPRSPKHEAKDESSPPKSPWGINIMKKAKKASPKAFGVRLEDCQPATNNKFIPLIVEICCGLVEDMGLEYTGIYRVPGNNAVVSSLQEHLNKGGDINIAEEKWQDLNVISSLLKSFFRKLPEPLFTDDKYSDFIEANRMDNASDRLRTMKKLIRDLPDYYFHTLKFLIGHLKTVADHSEKNKMEPRNLALVFGPTLVRTSEDNMTDMVTHMPDRYKIVETLIQHHAWFFSDEHETDEKTPVDTEDVQPAPNIDHLLSNIGRTGLQGEASGESGSWGSKRDFSAKDILTLSIMSAVTRKRRKRHNGRLLGSSTDDDSEQKAQEQKEEVVPSMSATEEAAPAVLLREEEEQRSEVKGRSWRGDDAGAIVSGYSTLSTLGRSLASEGRGEDADDEHSELVSETDNESGFTPSASSGATFALRHSFNSHRLIQCDTLARRRLKADKAKAPSVDLSELSGNYLLSTGQGSLADQVRARLIGSADDLRSVGLRKKLSPETRRKRRAWRRHTVVVSPTDNSDKKTPAPPPKPLTSPSPVEKQDIEESRSETEDPTAHRVLPTSRFRDFL
uniref:Rho GTPase activating protein 23a n=1 Tax=Cyprinus carpio TaxID=7962 RepID=A0A8C2Q9J9_CYPCA